MADEEQVTLGDHKPVEGAPLARVSARLMWGIEKSAIVEREGDTTIRTPDGPRELAAVLDEVDQPYFATRQEFEDAVRAVVGTGPIPTAGEPGDTDDEQQAESESETETASDDREDGGEPDDESEADADAEADDGEGDEGASDAETTEDEPDGDDGDEDEPDAEADESEAEDDAVADANDESADTES